MRNNYALLAVLLVLTPVTTYADEPLVPGLRAQSENEWNELQRMAAEAHKLRAKALLEEERRRSGIKEIEPDSKPSSPRVVGYIGAGSEGVAMVRMPNGNLLELRKGDVVHDMVVEAVEPGRVQLMAMKNHEKQVWSADR